MAHPLLVGGLLVSVLFAVATKKKSIVSSSPTGGSISSTANKWGLLACDMWHTPTGGSGAATPGRATHPDYQWCYVVQDGDSAGLIAEKMLGASLAWRYVELLAANPQKPTTGDTVSPDGSDSELNFVSLEAGERLNVPRTWNRWIDQSGRPSGNPLPYPS